MSDESLEKKLLRALFGDNLPDDANIRFIDMSGQSLEDLPEELSSIFQALSGSGPQGLEQMFQSILGMPGMGRSEPPLADQIIDEITTAASAAKKAGRPFSLEEFRSSTHGMEFPSEEIDTTPVDHASEPEDNPDAPEELVAALKERLKDNVHLRECVKYWYSQLGCVSKTRLNGEGEIHDKVVVEDDIMYSFLHEVHERSAYEEANKIKPTSATHLEGFLELSYKQKIEVLRSVRVLH